MRMPAAGLGPLELRRSYDAAPERVWRAWTDAGALRVWFGQTDVTAWQADWRVQAGNRFRMVMGDREGRSWLAYGAFRDVQPARRLTFTWTWRPLESDPGDGVESIITVQLAAVDGGTELAFRLDPMTDPREVAAWRADFVRLADYLRAEPTR